jgi:hypothetical protein
MPRHKLTVLSLVLGLRITQIWIFIEDPCNELILCAHLSMLPFESFKLSYSFLLRTVKERETAVAQWLRYCATSQKVAGSIPDGVIEIFHWHKSFWSHYGPGVDSASNINEYQEYFLGANAAGAWGWQPYHHPVPLSWNLGTLTSWNPLGHPGL